MNNLKSILESVAAGQNGGWKVRKRSVEVRLAKRGRRQSVYFERDGKYYLFKSVVLGAAAVTRSDKRWNQLALLSWLYKAEHELVTFAFDKRNRLIGLIRHPAEWLDPVELELYVTTLARDCDRFEFLLRGYDKF